MAERNAIVLRLTIKHKQKPHPRYLGCGFSINVYVKLSADQVLDWSELQLFD